MKAFRPANSFRKGYLHYALLMPESMKRTAGVTALKNAHRPDHQQSPKNEPSVERSDGYQLTESIHVAKRPGARRASENPIITPAMVQPSRPDLDVVGAFNPAAIRYGDEILLLLRVAEAPRVVAALDALNVTVGMKSAAHFFGPTQFLRSVGSGVDKDQIGGISTYFLTGARLRRLARRLTSFELDPRLRRCRTACCVSGVQKIRRRSRARVMAV